MRTDAPITGDPWPHDMSITVEEQPHALVELLWIREAYGLRPRGEDLPPLLLDSPRPARGASTGVAARERWEQEWPAIWRAAEAHAGLDHDPRLFDELHATPSGSTRRADLLRQIGGPDWRESFGGDALDDDSYREWVERLSDALPTAMPRRLEEQPERRDLAALIAAWRAGLTRIVAIPCIGEFTRRVGENALLMTARTRENSDSYRRALFSFI